MSVDWFSFVLGVVSVFAVLGLSIFSVALAVAVKKMKAVEAAKGKK